MLYKGFDAAAPPVHPPPGCLWAAGYIGGRASRLWTLADWVSVRELRQFPVWVADLAADPVAQARHASLVASRMGWDDDLSRVIVCDTEAGHNRAWYQAWSAQLHLGGFLEANYGSLGTPAAPIVEANGSARIWAAKWDGRPILEGGQRVLAHQYAADVPEAGTVVDLSVMAHDLLLLGGLGTRRAAP